MLQIFWYHPPVKLVPRVYLTCILSEDFAAFIFKLFSTHQAQTSRRAQFCKSPDFRAFRSDFRDFKDFLPNSRDVRDFQDLKGLKVIQQF